MERGVSINIPWNIYAEATAKFLPTWGVSQKYFPGPFTVLRCLGGISAPQAHSRVSNINFDILIFFYGGGTL